MNGSEGTLRPGARERHAKPFEIRVEPRGRTLLWRLSGEFDVAGKKEFEKHLADLGAIRPADVVLDLREVVYIDSTGLRLVLEVWNRSQRDGFDFAVLQADGHVRRMLGETGLDQVLPIVADLPASEYRGVGRGSGSGSG